MSEISASLICSPSPRGSPPARCPCRAAASAPRPGSHRLYHECLPLSAHCIPAARNMAWGGRDLRRALCGQCSLPGAALHRSPRPAPRSGWAVQFAMNSSAPHMSASHSLRRSRPASRPRFVPPAEVCPGCAATANAPYRAPLGQFSTPCAAAFHPCRQGTACTTHAPRPAKSAPARAALRACAGAGCCSCGGSLIDRDPVRGGLITARRALVH